MKPFLIDSFPSRCNLEKHLNYGDFKTAFNMSKDTFYSLPPWKRNDLKRRAKLF